MGLAKELGEWNDKEKLKMELFIDFLVVISGDLVQCFILSPALKMARGLHSGMAPCF